MPAVPSADEPLAAGFGDELGTYAARVALYHELAGVGPSVVLVHEAAGDSRMWDPQWDPLIARHRTLRLDLPGFGHSPLESARVSFAGETATLLDAVGTRRAAIVGASLGGRVALELAVARPDLVAALVLVAAGHPAHEWSGAIKAYWEAEDDAVTRGDLDAAVELGLRTWIDGPRRQPHDVDAGLRAAVAEMMRRSYELQAPMWADLEMDHLVPDLAGRLAEIDRPTLVVVGAEDVEDIHESGRRLARDIRGARHAVIPAAAHAPMMERPAEFNELVLGFLSEVLSSG